MKNNSINVSRSNPPIFINFTSVKEIFFAGLSLATNISEMVVSEFQPSFGGLNGELSVSELLVSYGV